MIQKISKIKINNFQSHQQTEIDLVDGLNLITGTSDSGKSAVVRAITWLLQGRPSGDVHNWNTDKKDPVLVRIDYPVDHSDVSEIGVGKKREGSSSSYFIDCDLDVAEYNVVGRDIPEEVKKALNLSEINIQTQHDPYFLLNDSSGEIARKLNEYVGLDVIDKVFKFLNSKTLATKEGIRKEDQNGKALQEQIDNLQWIDPVKKTTDELHEKMCAARQTRIWIDTVTAIVKMVAEIDIQIKEVAPILKMEKMTAQLESNIAAYHQRADRYNAVFDMIHVLRDINRDIEAEMGWESIEKLSLMIEEKANKIIDATERWRTVDGIAQECRWTLRDIEKESKAVVIAQAVFDDLLRDNGVCPLCGAITKKRGEKK